MIGHLIVDDKRTIKSVCYEPDGSYTVGHNGITTIEPYYENGEMAPVVWFKVWRGRHLWVRLNGKQIASVMYAEVG